MDGNSPMDSATIIQIVILVVLLILSGLFSSAETALTTVSKYKIKPLAEKGKKRAKLVLKLIENPGKLLSTILIGNNIVNLTASSLTTVLVTHLFGDATVGIATGVLTVMILIFGEITPKTLATIYNVKLSMLYAGPIYALSIVLTPVIWILDRICDGIFFVLRVDAKARNRGLTELELRSIVNASHEDGVIEEDEKDIITNVVDFGDSVAKDIMIPRADMTMASIDASHRELFELFREEQYSRLPIYEETKENVVGILHLKDWFFAQNAALLEGDQNIDLNIRDIMREPHYTYEYQKTSGILEELRENSHSITIVLDEYGCAAGMITIEDLLEEIVGEIRDEYDEYEEEVIKEIAPGVYDIDGGAKIDDVNDALNLKLLSEDYDSVGGLMIELLDHLPEEGESIETQNVRLQVLRTDKNRVERVKLTVLEEDPLAEE